MRRSRNQSSTSSEHNRSTVIGLGRSEAACGGFGDAASGGVGQETYEALWDSPATGTDTQSDLYDVPNGQGTQMTRDDRMKQLIQSSGDVQTTPHQADDKRRKFASSKKKRAVQSLDDNLTHKSCENNITQQSSGASNERERRNISALLSRPVYAPAGPDDDTDPLAAQPSREERLALSREISGRQLSHGNRNVSWLLSQTVPPSLSMEPEEERRIQRPQTRNQQPMSGQNSVQESKPEVDVSAITSGVTQVFPMETDAAAYLNVGSVTVKTSADDEIEAIIEQNNSNEIAESLLSNLDCNQNVNKHVGIAEVDYLNSKKTSRTKRAAGHDEFTRTTLNHVVNDDNSYDDEEEEVEFISHLLLGSREGPPPTVNDVTQVSGELEAIASSTTTNTSNQDITVIALPSDGKDDVVTSEKSSNVTGSSNTQNQDHLSDNRNDLPPVGATTLCADATSLPVGATAPLVGATPPPVGATPPPPETDDLPPETLAPPPPPPKTANVPPSHVVPPPLRPVVTKEASQSLREAQTKELTKQQKYTTGVKVILKRRDCFQKIAFIECSQLFWIAGWKQMSSPVLSSAFHIADRIISINGREINSLKLIHELIKEARDTDNITFVLHRIPAGRAYLFKRDKEGQDLGLKRMDGTGEICGVVMNSPAVKQGLFAAMPAVRDDTLCHPYITEINNRPINLYYKDKEIESLLGSVGREISLVVHPIDLINEFKRKLKALKGYKDYLL